MQRTILLNGKIYPAKDIDMNTICDLEDMGASVSDIRGKRFSVIRAYAALCVDNPDIEAVGRMIKSRKEINSISEAFSEALQNADFFQDGEETEGAETPSIPQQTAAETVPTAQIVSEATTVNP